MTRTSTRGVRISRRGDVLTLDFGGSAVVRVDLKQVKMTSAQSRILNKLVRSRPGFTLTECTGDECPAAKKLPPEEFRQIRGLRAKIGTRGVLAGLICDFCLKCVKIPQ